MIVSGLWDANRALLRQNWTKNEPCGSKWVHDRDSSFSDRIILESVHGYQVACNIDVVLYTWLPYDLTMLQYSPNTIFRHRPVFFWLNTQVKRYYYSKFTCNQYSRSIFSSPKISVKNLKSTNGWHSLNIGRSEPNEDSIFDSVTCRAPCACFYSQPGSLGTILELF